MFFFFKTLNSHTLLVVNAKRINYLSQENVEEAIAAALSLLSEQSYNGFPSSAFESSSPEKFNNSDSDSERDSHKHEGLTSFQIMSSRF